MVALTPVEIRPPSPHQDPAYLSRLDAELQTLRVERLERQMAEKEAGSQRNNVPWIVGGCLVALMMLISFGWSVLGELMAFMETTLSRHHELAMTAAKPAPAAQKAAEGGDMMVVGALLVLAAICIIFGVLRR